MSITPPPTTRPTTCPPAPSRVTRALFVDYVDVDDETTADSVSLGTEDTPDMPDSPTHEPISPTVGRHIRRFEHKDVEEREPNPIFLDADAAMDAYIHLLEQQAAARDEQSIALARRVHEVTVQTAAMLENIRALRREEQAKNDIRFSIQAERHRIELERIEIERKNEREVMLEFAADAIIGVCFPSPAEHDDRVSQDIADNVVRIRRGTRRNRSEVVPDEPEALRRSERIRRFNWVSSRR